MNPFRMVLAVAAITTALAPALAQDAAVFAGKNRFTLADFAQFSPVTALDMVQRIPGFSIEGSEGRRGFGDNAGNVLIDGDRPSTKTDDIFTILSRIPASEVDYLQLTENAGGDSEARGKGQVVNVIRKTGKKVSGTYRVGAQLGENRGVEPFGKASVSLRRGATTFELNAERFAETFRGRGPEAFFDGQRRLEETRTYLGVGNYRQWSLGGSVKTRTGDVKINANVKADWRNGFDLRNGLLTGPTGAPIGTELLLSDGPDREFDYEVGGDIEFPIAAKLTSKLIALWRDGEDNGSSFIESVRTGQPTTRFDAVSRDKPDEAILRVQNDWIGIKDHAIQFGGEVARNRLDARFASTSLIGGVSSASPQARAIVSELRFEPFVSDVWSISPAWKLEAGLVFETSKLKLRGDSREDRRLSFWKPRLVGTWTLDKLTTFEFRADREVAQLDFGEFATSVDLGAGNQVDAGNSELVPEVADRISALVRRKFMERGSIQFNVEHEWIKDTQDLVPVTLRDAAGNITGRFDGSGNIGKSRRWNFELEITLPFDWITKSIGINGMELKYVGHYHGSRVTDPVTGLSRRMSGRPLWHQEWNFRHDIGKTGLAWGVFSFHHAPFRRFFVDQLREERENGYYSAFVEYKKFKLGTLKLEVSDFTRQRFNRDRTFYRDTRASGEVIRIIERERRLDRRIDLSLSGKF